MKTREIGGAGNWVDEPRRPGFTLIEAIVTIAVFAILLLTVISISQQIHNLATISRFKTTAATIAQEQMELIRNLPYDQVGSDVTYPTGPLPSSQTVTRNGGKFTVSIAINYVDDPADGLLPADTVPADYKKVAVRVCWDSGSCNNPVRLTTLVVPKTLEYTANAGAMFITVVDANAQPVSGATVHVTNATPAVDVVNQTDVNGQLQLLNLPASENSYRVTATKNGFSSDQTVAVTTDNPKPTNPDASVRANEKVDVLLAIDRVSSLTINALDQSTCDGLGSVAVRIIGERLIGKEPNVPAYDKTFVTDAAGQFVVANLPWDNYSFSITSIGDDIAGVTPPDNIKVNPGSTVTGSVVLAAHQPETVRIIVRDASTHGPIANAKVTLTDGAGYSSELITDQGILQQNTWVGGPGQTDFTDATKFSAVSGGIDVSAPNIINLGTVSTTNQVAEDFHTTDNRDSGATTADWLTGPGNIQLPTDTLIPGQYQPTAEAQSTKLNAAAGAITVVTLDATADAKGQSISYAVAADGATFETVTPGVAHTFATTGSDLRWRVKFDTVDDPTVTPQVTALSLRYTQLTRPEVSGTLTSSTFDSGRPTNYTTLSWDPTGQPPTAGSDAVRFQVATAGSTVANGSPTVDVTSNPSTTPLFTKNIGDADTTLWVAQSFIAGANDTIDSIDLKIAQHGTPTTTLTAFIYNDSGNAPGDNLSGSGQDITATIPSDSSSTWQNTWLTQSFSPHTALVAGTKYWLVLNAGGSNSSKFWTIVRSNADSTYASGTALVGSALNTLDHICTPVAPNTGCDIAFQIRRSGVTETAITPTNFIGPDGTSNSYYNVSGSTLHSSLSGFRYLRYKLFLHTDDPVVSPSVSRISIIKNNACTPPGQVFFSPLPGAGTYTADVIADGYQSASTTVDVSGNSSQYIELTANP